ncbi:hypothetical protein B0H14DRAFT_3496952 [Mycena olivaceomarginata]|nr:hypothetical protein B0H14DRAFT_3496952 [Mycena olivaceomarginata]
MLYRCYVCIWRLQPASANKMRRTRMYTSLCSAEYNEETIRLMEKDPEFQIILATIAFSNGINAKALLDSLTLGASASMDITVQEKGRVGREEGTLARGIVFVQKSTITLAKKTIAATSQPTPLRPTKGKGSRKQKAPDPMSLIKAKFLTESHCYIAFLNIHFQNPPIVTSRLDCLTAKRLLPCSLCLARSNRTLDFPAPLSTPKFPALISPSPSKTHPGCSRKLKLTRDERNTVKEISSNTPAPCSGLGVHAILRDRQKKHATVCFLGLICSISVILNVWGHRWPSGYGYPANDSRWPSAGMTLNGESSGRGEVQTRWVGLQIRERRQRAL